MTFWQSVAIASGMGATLIWLILFFIVVSVGLSAIFPKERPRIKTSLALLALSLTGLFLSGYVLSSGGTVETASYRWIHWAASLFLVIAVVNVASVIVFDLALSSVRLTTPRILRDLLIAFSYIIAAIYLLTHHGVDLTGVIATSTVITAVIGLSFQDTLGNIMGGVVLQMEKTVGVGDWVRLDQIEGRVKEIRWRFTSLETRNWDTVIVPNSVLMKSQVTLLGRREGEPVQHRQQIAFNVDFRSSPPAVIDAVQSALRAEPIAAVAMQPQPDCIFSGYQESFGVYTVRYWLTDIAADGPTDSVIRQRIYFALRRANIMPSIPAQSVFITQDDQSRREQKATHELAHRIRSLRDIELFRVLTDAELAELAKSLKVAPFVRGEAITRQGATAHWLYIIISGDVEIRVALAEGELSKTVAVLHAGDFFGEAGMLTGEPRAATVVATTDVECYRLDKEAFTGVITRRPEIAHSISEVMVRRKVETEAIRDGLDEEAKRLRIQQRKGDMIHKILRFFSIGNDHQEAGENGKVGEKADVIIPN